MSAFAILALITYLFSLSLIIPSLLRKNSNYRRWALLFAAIALISHALTLQQCIFDVSTGQNLSLLNISSAVSLVVCTIMTIVASRDRGWFLLPLVYSFSIINLALAYFLPFEFITHIEATPSLMIHITLALFSYATLIIAALYALQLAIVDYLLKHKKLVFTPDMPPLMAIERKMFHITQIGVVLLSLTLITGGTYIKTIFDAENIHKAVLSLAAWCVYLVLLSGHYRKGWRGTRVVWLSFCGTALLTLAYFGNRLILQ